jgi:hypothetical protein
VFDEEGYRKLAVHVLAMAVKDYERLSKQRPSHEGRRSAEVYDSRIYRTAESLLLNHENHRLELWCAWLQVDPNRVRRIYAATFAVGRRSGHSQAKPDE